MDEFNTEDRKILKKWWKDLHEDRKGDRAELRRCETVSEIYLCRAFHHLSHMLPYWGQNYPEGVAILACLLAMCKEEPERDQSFGSQMATKQKKSDSPAVSELRFKKLQGAKDENEFLRFMRRAVAILRGCVDIVALADCVFHWAHNQKAVANFQLVPANEQFQFVLAKDYYSTLFNQEGENS